MKKINAKLSISYPSDRTVSITLTDESSRTDFFKGRISYDEFTSALSSLACRPFVHAEAWVIGVLLQPSGVGCHRQRANGFEIRDLPIH